MRKRLFAVCAILLSCGALAGAQDLSGYTKILLPAYTPVPISGANGATFRTDVLASSRGPVSIYAGLDPNGNPSFETWEWHLRTRLPGVRGGAAGASGRFLYVERAHADDVSLIEILTSTDSAGGQHRTAVPIVRTPFTSTAEIYGFGFINSAIVVPQPIGPSHLVGFTRRTTLRVYDFDGDGSGAVTVRLGAPDGRSGFPTVSDRVVTLNQRGAEGPEYPYYGELPLDRCVGQLPRDPCPDLIGYLAVTPLTPGLRYYPLVSSTDNRTQEVLLLWADPVR